MVSLRLTLTQGEQAVVSSRCKLTLWENRMLTFTLAALAKFSKTTSLYARIWHLPRVGMRQSWGGGGLFKKNKKKHSKNNNSAWEWRRHKTANREAWKNLGNKKKTKTRKLPQEQSVTRVKRFGSRPAFSVLRLSITHITRRTCYEILCFPRPTSKINKWLFQVMFLLSDINGKQLFEARAAGVDAAAAHTCLGDKDTQRSMNENGCYKVKCKN